MLLAYHGEADRGERLGTILGRTWELHRFAAGRDPLPAAAAAVLVFDHAAALDRLMALHAECSRRQLPWSLVVDRGRHLQIGPLFASWIVPLCPQCVSHRLLNAPADGVSLDKALMQRRVASEMMAASAPGYPQPLLHLIAATAIAQLLDPATHAGRAVMLDSVGFTVARAALSGVHGCRTCRPESSAPAKWPFAGRTAAVPSSGAVA